MVFVSQNVGQSSYELTKLIMAKWCYVNRKKVQISEARAAFKRSPLQAERLTDRSLGDTKRHQGDDCGFAERSNMSPEIAWAKFGQFELILRIFNCETFSIFFSFPEFSW